MSFTPLQQNLYRSSPGLRFGNPGTAKCKLEAAAAEAPLMFSSRTPT
jgi:hypothetical protein